MSNKKNNKQFGFIYKIHCIPEDKYYIGQTRRSVQKRWKENCDGKKKSTKAGEPVCLIDRLIHDLGKDNFELEIIEKPLVDDLNDREKYWIAECGTLFPDGYNMNSGGGS